MSQPEGSTQAPSGLTLAACVLASQPIICRLPCWPLQALWTAFRDVHESLSALPYNLARSGTTAVVCIVTKKW